MKSYHQCLKIIIKGTCNSFNLKIWNQQKNIYSTKIQTVKLLKLEETTKNKDYKDSNRKTKIRGNN